MSTSDDSGRSDDPSPGPSPEPTGKVKLPAFGLAADILRRMGATPEPPATTPEPSVLEEQPPPPPPAAAPSLVVPAHSEPAAAAPPSPTSATPAAMGPPRDSLLQFADAMLNVGQAGGDRAIVAPVEEEHVVSFFLDREEYALPVSCTREIVRVGTFTRIPESPPHVRGVFNLRGRVVPVIDLRSRIGLPPADPTPRSRLILVEAHGRVLSLLVDALSSITRIPTASIKPPPSETLSAHTDYVRGVSQQGDRLVIFLEVDRVLLLHPGSGAPHDHASAAAQPASQDGR